LYFSIYIGLLLASALALTSRNYEAKVIIDLGLIALALLVL